MLTPGTRLGPYEITALLGQGGMGEVYRARDTKLDRDVAIKILPAEFAADSDRLARFEREARTLASLNHPNIAHVHGAEEAGSTRAIVMELVGGDDLSQRIARGPIARPEALAIARQIADAMQAAHDHGIVHRDLKPANVKVTRDGTVKVLDFGLAKAADREPEEGSLSHSPTLMTSMPGTLLGTAAYMSPEQARGHPADARADVWACGCILFEMLTGRPAFAGTTTSEILAGVLTAEPDWGALPPDTPVSIRRLLRRCLDKNMAHRLRAIADAKLEIDDAERPERELSASPPMTTSHGKWLAWAGAAALLGASALAWTAWPGRSPPAPPEVRFDIDTPPVADPILLPPVAVSPDGRQLLFIADSEGQPHLWLRDIHSVTARPLSGTAGGYSPFWSPDGRSVAFYADGFLKRLDLDGGLVRTLARSTVGIGGTWSRDGVILFVRNPASAIARVSAEGGPVAEVTQVEAGQVGHTFPHFLPDGAHFLYYITAAPDLRGVHVGQLDGSPARRLLDADSHGVYSNGHVLFVRQTGVFAQRFDVTRLELAGSPFQIAEGVLATRPRQALTLSAGASALAFRAGTAGFVRQFTWVDRSGHEIATVGKPLATAGGVSYAPDRGQLVFFERGPTGSDLWVLDTRRGALSRFTEEPDEDIFPLWARDGSRIIYTVVRDGRNAIYQKHTGTGGRELLTAPQTEEMFASDVSPDGGYMVYQRMDPTSGWDIWAQPLGRNGEPILVVQTNGDERAARLSPDGRWVAFASKNSGVSEVYVQPFLAPGRPLQISTRGGDQPQWRANGRELFYLALDGKLMAASITAPPDHISIHVGTPVPLFAAQVGGVIRPVITADYAPSADGQRFLVNRLVRDASETPVRVVLNWTPPEQR